MNIILLPEALEAAAIEIAPHPWSMYTDAAKDHFRHEARAAILAALSAWPGAYQTEHTSFNGKTWPRLILPLAQEARND